MRVERLGKEKFRVYLRKATEFERTMEKAVEAGDWNAVGLNGVHAVISAADAMTCFFLGERSRGEDHEDVVGLLERVPLPDAKDRAEQVLKVLRVKNLVEYEARDFGAREATELAKRVRRIVAWAKEQLR